MTSLHLMEGFLNWCQLPGWRFPPMVSMAKCPWSSWAIKLEDISCGLTWRVIGSARFTYPWHITHNWIPLRLYSQVLSCTATLWSHPVTGLMMMTMMNVKIPCSRAVVLKWISLTMSSVISSVSTGCYKSMALCQILLCCVNIHGHLWFRIESHQPVIWVSSIFTDWSSLMALCQTELCRYFGVMVNKLISQNITISVSLGFTGCTVIITSVQIKLW